ncbi:hypothetical protein ACP70R_018159 [Stipagrostis hirtigluma subsp. patula]
MLTEEEIAELDEETQEVIRAIQAERRAFKPSEERIRITNLIKTDPAAAAIEIRERSLRRFEERVGPQRDYILRQRKLQEEKDAAAAARAKARVDGSNHGERGGAADRPAEQVKRQCLGARPDITPKISRVLQRMRPNPMFDGNQ